MIIIRKNRRKKKNKHLKVQENKTLKSILLLIIFILFFLILLSLSKLSFNNDNLQAFSDDIAFINENTIAENTNIINENTMEKNTVSNNLNKDTTFSIAVIGDIMCHNTQYTDAYNSSTGTYDFSYIFDDINYYIKTADLAIGNLETTFAGSTIGYSSYPTFNTPEALAKNLKKLGIDVLSTANNHSLDKGYYGIESTLNYLDEADIAHTGTFKSEEEQNNILIKDVKGVKIAFLSYTYGTNGIPVPSSKDYCINLIDENLILKHLELAKNQKPDIICVSMHWGIEYQTKQNKEQEQLADFLFANGVDIILGSHPHVLQSMEKRNITLDDGSTKDGFVIYSLGNFISGQVKENTKDSIILNLKITKNGKTGKISIDNVTYIPIYMHKSSAKEKKYKLLDIEKSIQNYNEGTDTSIDQSLYNTLITELDKIRKFVGEEIN